MKSDIKLQFNIISLNKLKINTTDEIRKYHKCTITTKKSKE